MSAPEDTAVPERWTRSTVYADMWVDPDDDPREEYAASDDERDILLENLRAYRLTFEMKCDGLDAEQMATRSVPPSTMSLLGLLRHLTEDERHVRRVMLGGDTAPVYRTDADRDGDWNGAVADAQVVAEAWRRWRSEIELTDQAIAEVTDLASHNQGVSDLGPVGADLSWREMLVAHIVEYARHCGHADLLRERLDGRVGQ